MESRATEDLIQGPGILASVAFTSCPDGTIVAECTDIPGCISQGETISEAKANIADASYRLLSLGDPGRLITAARRRRGLGVTPHRLHYVWVGKILSFPPVSLRGLLMFRSVSGNLFTVG